MQLNIGQSLDVEMSVEVTLDQAATPTCSLLDSGNLQNYKADCRLEDYGGLITGRVTRSPSYPAYGNLVCNC